jgi:mono/diheme cytochrome c family protein
VKLLPPLLLTVAALAIGASLGLAAESDKAAEKRYTITDGKVDKKTFNGWRRYTESCLRCHGPDGAGSSYAPSLVDSAKHMTQDEFNEIVVNGRTSARSRMWSATSTTSGLISRRAPMACWAAAGRRVLGIR